MKVYRVILKEEYRDTTAFDFESGARAGDFVRDVLDHHKGAGKMFAEVQIADSDETPETYVDYLVNKSKEDK